MSEINLKLLVHKKKILMGTATSVQVVFRIIEKSNSPLRISEIFEVTHYSDRTVRLALTHLYALNLVIKVPDIHDFRSHFFSLSPELVSA